VQRREGTVSRQTRWVSTHKTQVIGLIDRRSGEVETTVFLCGFVEIKASQRWRYPFRGALALAGSTDVSSATVCLDGTLIGAIRQRWGEEKCFHYLHEWRSSRSERPSGTTIDVMKIEAVIYELTDAPVGKDGPSGCEPNPEGPSSAFESASEGLRGCRSKMVTSVMSSSGCPKIPRLTFNWPVW
jgi:hypothetical protein